MVIICFIGIFSDIIDHVHDIGILQQYRTYYAKLGFITSDLQLNTYKRGDRFGFFELQYLRNHFQSSIYAFICNLTVLAREKWRNKACHTNQFGSQNCDEKVHCHLVSVIMQAVSWGHEASNVNKFSKYDWPRNCSKDSAKKKDHQLSEQKFKD